jgi:uncharacterized protein YjbI with pentapeptide repeats
MVLGGLDRPRGIGKREVQGSHRVRAGLCVVCLLSHRRIGPAAKALLRGRGVAQASLDVATVSRACLDVSAISRASFDGAAVARASFDSAAIMRASLDGAAITRASLHIGAAITRHGGSVGGSIVGL